MKKKNKKLLTSIISAGLCLTLAFGASACGDSSGSSGSTGSGTTGSSPEQPATPVKLDAVNVEETVRSNINGITDADIQGVLDGDKNLFALVFNGVTVGDAFVSVIDEIEKAIKEGKIDGDVTAGGADSSGELSKSDLPDTATAFVAMFKCGYYDKNGKKVWCLERESTDGESIDVISFTEVTNALFKYSLSSIGNDNENIAFASRYKGDVGASLIAFDSIISNFLGGTIKGEMIVKSFKEQYPSVDPAVLEWGAGLTVKDIYDFSCGDYSCAGDMTFGQVIKFFKDTETAAKEKGQTSQELSDYDFSTVYAELDKLVGKIKIAEFRQEFKKLSLYSTVDAVSVISVDALKAEQADADAFTAYIKEVYESDSTLGALKVKAGKTVDFKKVAELAKKLAPEVKQDSPAA